MPEGINQWLGAAALIVSLCTTVYAWMTSRAKANSEHLKTVDAKLTDHGSQIQWIQAELKHMPSKDDVTELKLAVSEVRGTVGRLDESVSGVSRTMRRVEGYLMKEGN